MASFSGVAFALLFIISRQVARAAPSEGLYVTNGTDILFIPNPQSQSASSIYNKGKRIAGLAHGSGFIYWSEVDAVERGIYRAATDNNNRLVNVTKIVGSEDVMEVNCLSFDWISKHLYWVDERKRTLEVADSDGTNRRILVLSGLQRPRCVYADPINGYLFWSDQGRKHISRADLDGSDVKVIVAGLTWPNQLIVHDRKLYWVDSSDKTFQSSNVDGGERTSASVSSLANNQNIFGLATDGQKAYITNWKNGQILTIDLNGNNPRIGTQNLGTEFIFSAIYVKSSLRQEKTDPCSGKGCASLCLPIKAGGARCSCPSFGGKTLNAGDQKTCSPPTSVLVYALADSGFVAYHDPSAHPNGDLYLIGRSLRPVAVAYDSLRKTAYWSDVRERTIHIAKLDGTDHRILLGSQQGIGLVEGMVVDVGKRQLFYTNVGEVRLNDVIYSWHKVETFRMDSAIVKVRTLVASAERPRAVALDTNGHLYYTDWGSRASIVRIELDGSNPTLIRTGLDNPNGIAIFDNKLYLVDSHFKTRQQDKGQYPPPPKNGSLYSMNLDGSAFTDVLRESSTKLQTPFGIAVSSDGIYVSDWEKKFLVAFNFNGSARVSSVLDEVSGIMSLAYSSVETTPGSGSDGCSSNTCQDMCLAKNRSETFCTCNSYSGKSLDSDSKRCTLPSEFLIVADMNSIKLVSLDGRDSNPYTLVQGNPFLSNFAGLAYDPRTETVYYSDVNRRVINAVNLVNMSTSAFYRINSVIDGMAVSDGLLFWTDFSNGRISYLSLTTPNAQHTNLIIGLKRPRGIRVTNDRGNRNVYWTEWGKNSRRVAMLELDGDNRLKSSTPKEILKSSDLIWLNGIFLHEQRLYAVDGFSENRKLFNCSNDGSSRGGSCPPLPGINDTMKHAYDIWMVREKIYYSDWKTGAVNAYDPKTPGSVWPVIEGLMRPTQMHIHFDSTKNPDNCRGNRCNDGGCLNLLGTHRCNCSGKVPTFDLKGCSGPGSTCSNSGKSYSSGQTYRPAPCLECQCYGVIPYSDPVYNGSICRRTVCPNLDCNGGDIQPPADGACCPRCKSCGIKITNCPDKPILLPLPDNRNFAVRDFLPAVKDCSGYASEVSFTKSPPGSIYRQKTEVVVTASSKPLGKEQDQHDHDTCTFTIEVTDHTPPSIKCPPDVIAYLTGDETSKAVSWNPPEASDNVGIQGNPVADPPFGSSFVAGKHIVHYTVKDTSGLESSCNFTVTVDKLKAPGTCQIPNVNNGNMKCSFDTVLMCSLICNTDYKPSDTEPFKCQSGTWNKDIRDDFQQKACIKVKTKSARASIKVAAVVDGDCSKWNNLDYTRDSLKSSIQDTGYLQSSDVLRNSRMTVNVSECMKNPNKSDSSIVNVVIRLTGYSRNRDQARSDIDGALEKVEDELKRDFIRVTFVGKSELKTAESVSLTRSPAAFECLPGEIQRDSDDCVVCSYGTYQDGDQCQPCTTDFYNNEEGQINCKRCPEGQRSPNASTTIEQCKLEPWSMPSWLLYAILGVLSIILVAIIIAVVCVISRRRSRTRKPYELNHRNGTFDPNMEDETYDKIDDVCKDFDETYDKIPDNLNSYERLEACGAPTINYDTIGKEKFQQDDPKAAQSPNGQASPNDYYLDPVVEAQRASRAVKRQDSPPEDHYLKPVEETPADSRVTSAVSYLKLEEGDTTPPGNAGNTYQVGGGLLKPPASVNV